jgi:hypothetical protein
MNVTRPRLVGQDADGAANLTDNDPAWIAARHALGDGVAPAVRAMAAALEGLARPDTAFEGETHPAAGFRGRKRLTRLASQEWAKRK